MTPQEMVEQIKQQPTDAGDSEYVDHLAKGIDGLDKHHLVILKSLHHKYCKYTKEHECNKDCSYVDKHTDYLEELWKLHRFTQTKEMETPWEQNLQTMRSLESLLGDGDKERAH